MLKPWRWNEVHLLCMSTCSISQAAEVSSSASLKPFPCLRQDMRLRMQPSLYPSVRASCGARARHQSSPRRCRCCPPGSGTLSLACPGALTLPQRRRHAPLPRTLPMRRQRRMPARVSRAKSWAAARMVVQRRMDPPMLAWTRTLRRLPAGHVCPKPGR